MAVRTDRVETGVSPDQGERIERAAAFPGESMSAFVVADATSRWPLTIPLVGGR